MAKKAVIQLIDDLDGTAIENGDGRSVTFSLEGVHYEIDLSAKNAERLQDALSPFIAAGRRVSSGARRRSGGRPSAGGDLREIRSWARENGYNVSDRGRVSSEVRAAYEAR